MKCVLVQENWVNYSDAVYDRVGNIEMSRILGADVRLDAAGFAESEKNSSAVGTPANFLAASGRFRRHVSDQAPLNRVAAAFRAAANERDHEKLRPFTVRPFIPEAYRQLIVYSNAF